MPRPRVIDPCENCPAGISYCRTCPHNKSEKAGACDSCGRYSANLEYDEDVGLWKCRKCMRSTEKAAAKAVHEGYLRSQIMQPRER